MNGRIPGFKFKMTERYVRVDENAIAEARRALDAKAASLGNNQKGELD